MRYIVKSVVCDYGVFEKTDNGEQLKVICDSLSNAELIADILNTDLRNTKYEAVERSKIDKARAEILKNVYQYSGSGNEITQAYCDGLKDSLEMVVRNIGE